MTHGEHRARLAAFGFTHKDRARIRAMALKVRDTGQGFEPYPLDAPWLAAAVPAHKRRFWTGQKIGEKYGCAILVWPKEPDLFDGR